MKEDHFQLIVSLALGHTYNSIICFLEVIVVLRELVLNLNSKRNAIHVEAPHCSENKYMSQMK